MSTKKTILITRELSDNSLIRQWAAGHGFQLMERSFIQTTAVPGLTIPKTDWIFFSSPQGASLYFETYTLQAKKIAALAEGTAQRLSKLGFDAQFTGNSDNSTQQTGRDFFDQLTPGETVLFPLSNISRRAVSSQKGDHPVFELITYKTAFVAEKVTTPDIILFTSPSNVDGFLLENQLTGQTKILAIGETTADHLRASGFTNIHVSPGTTEKALISALELLR